MYTFDYNIMQSPVVHEQVHEVHIFYNNFNKDLQMVSGNSWRG